jgi:hypothetical protein
MHNASDGSAPCEPPEEEFEYPVARDRMRHGGGELSNMQTISA